MPHLTSAILQVSKKCRLLIAPGGAALCFRSPVRPCAIVVAARRQQNNEIGVIVAPINREPPDDRSASLEVPAEVCRQFGLKSDRQWLRFDELNRFTWPNFDLRAIPEKNRVDYSMLPHSLFEALKAAILQRQRARKARPPADRD